MNCENCGHDHHPAMGCREKITSPTEPAQSGEEASMQRVGLRLYVTGTVLTINKEWGSLTIIHEMEKHMARSEDEAKGKAVTGAMARNPGSKLEIIRVVSAESQTAVFSDGEKGLST